MRAGTRRRADARLPRRKAPPIATLGRLLPPRAYRPSSPGSASRLLVPQGRGSPLPPGWVFLGAEGLADGDDVDQAAGAVEGREDLFGRVASAKLGDGVGAGSVGRQIHAAEERVAAPGAGELVGPLLG